MRLRLARTVLAVSAAALLSASPASAVPDMSLVSAVLGVDSTAEKSALVGPDSTDDVVGAFCPAGRFPHGLGATMTAPAGQAMYAGVYPAAALNATTALAVKDIDDSRIDVIRRRAARRRTRPVEVRGDASRPATSF
jgi:hypothetical protein